MAKLVFGMNQSLDGHVDHTAFGPSQTLFRHFIREAEGQTGSVYGRRMYEIMRYWDDEHPEWTADDQAFAAAWRRQRKWVVSSTLQAVGPNATLVKGDLEDAICRLKAEHEGEIEVAADPCGTPHRTWPDRRIPHLPAPGRAWPRQPFFHGAPAAAPPGRSRPDR